MRYSQIGLFFALCPAKNSRLSLSYRPQIDEKILNQTVYLLRLIRVGVVPRALNPNQRQLRVFVPLLIVPYAGTRVILRPAQQQGRASDFIRQIPFYCIRENTKAVSGNSRIALLIAVVDQHHFAHQTPPIRGRGDAFRASFQKRFPRIMRIHGLHLFQKPAFNRRHIFFRQRR